MLKKLLTTLLGSSMLLSRSGLSVLANEQETEEMESIFEEISDKDSQESTISESGEIYHSGKVGTANWTIDSTGTLTIGEGEFDYKGTSTSSNSSAFKEGDWPWWEFRSDIEYINGTAPFKTESYSMFAFIKLYNLKSVDLSGWDTSKSISFSHMFEGCSKLESIDLSSWDTSVLRETSSMFNNCRDLKVLNISGWNITKFWGASDMFTGCSNLYKIVYSGSPEIGQIISQLPNDYRWYQNGQGPYAVSEIPSLPQGATATLIREDKKEDNVTSSPSTPAPTINQKGEMYRLYNPNSGEHFYTGDTNEKDQLTSMGWKYEGIGWYAPSSSATPVYRLYNKNSSDHHYTIDINEKNTLVRAGWKDEGIGWYSDDAKTVPLYRVYNPNSAKSSHHYTTDQSERNSLVSTGWKDEGVAWYATKGGQLIPTQTDSTPGIQQEILKGAASTYVLCGGNVDTLGCLRLLDDGTFLAEEKLDYVDGTAMVSGYEICRYGGSMSSLAKITDHVYSAIIKDIYPSNTPLFEEYSENDHFKMKYYSQPKFLANDSKVYIFTPEATASEIKTYAPKTNASYLNPNDKHGWLIYTSYGTEIFGNSLSENPPLKKDKISEEEAKQIAIKYWGKAVNPSNQTVWNDANNPRTSKDGQEYYLFYLKARISNADGVPTHWSTQDWVYVNAYTGDCVFMGFNEF